MIISIFACAYERSRDKTWWFSDTRTTQAMFLGAFTCIFVIVIDIECFHEVSRQPSPFYMRLYKNI